MSSHPSFVLEGYFLERPHPSKKRMAWAAAGHRRFDTCFELGYGHVNYKDFRRKTKVPADRLRIYNEFLHLDDPEVIITLEDHDLQEDIQENDKEEDKSVKTFCCSTSSLL